MDIRCPSRVVTEKGGAILARARSGRLMKRRARPRLGSSVVVHLNLAAWPMRAVLFVCLLEVVQSEICLVFVQGLLGLLIRLARFFIGRAVGLFLGQDGCQNKHHSQTAADKSHRRPPADQSTRRSGAMEPGLTAESSFLNC